MPPVAPQQKKGFSLQALIIRYGLAKDAAGAQKVMLILTVLAAVAMWFLWSSGGSGKPPAPLPDGELLPEQIVTE